MKVLTFEDLFASDADKSSPEYGVKVKSWAVKTYKIVRDWKKRLC